MTNGNITGYQVYWTNATIPSAHGSANTTDTNYTILGLNAYVIYSVQVVAVTATGVGESGQCGWPYDFSTLIGRELYTFFNLIGLSSIALTLISR